MALPNAIFSRFDGGLNTNDRPTEIAGNEAQVLKHLFVDQVGRMVFAGGQHNVIPNQDGLVRGMMRYANAGTEGIPGISRLLFAAGGSVFTFDEAFQVQATLDTLTTIVGNVEFAGLYERAFYTDGSGPVRVWYGDGVPSRVGIVAPATEPTGSADGAGNLNSTGTPAYRWYVVFVNAHGVRSNPSPPSLNTPLTNEKALITDIAISTDPQVTAREIYRDGGPGGPVPRLVGSVPGNTITTFEDNISDTSLSLTQVETANDVPPENVSLLYPHNNRLFLSGVPAFPHRVWYSTFGEPEYYPEATVNQDTDLIGGSFDVPPRDNNKIIGLASTGSVLVIGRQRSIDILLGNSGTTFRVRQVAEIGVASHRSMVRCDNVVVFLGGDATVYVLDDEGPRPLGRKVEKTLLSLDGYSLQFACAAYVGQRYILCVPRGPGLTPLVLAYDFRVQAWSELSSPQLAASQMISDQAATVRGELLIAAADSYQTIEETNYSGIISVLTLTDQTQATIRWKSAAVDMGAPTRVKRVKSILVEGELILADPDQPVTVTIETMLDTQNLAAGAQIIGRTYKMDRTSGRLISRTLHGDLCGQTITVSIQGAILGGEISRVEIEYAVMG